MNLLQRLIVFASAAFLAGPALAQAPDTTPPVILGTPVVSLNTNPNAPLTGRVQVTANEPVVVEIFAQEATRGFRFQATNEFAAVQDLPLVGFRPGRPHRVFVAVRDAAGNRTKWPLAFVLTTPALPANFPPIRVNTTQPLLMEHGFTLTAVRWSSPTLPSVGTYVVYLDKTGQVVWLYETGIGLRDALKLRNGNLLIHANNRLAQEVDLFGNIVRQWWAARLGTTGAPAGAIPVDCDSFHHEMGELSVAENGNFIALSTEMRTYPNYPSNENDLTQTVPSANVVGDVVVEFRPSDGALVREFKFLDALDPYRICYGSLAGIYNQLYGGALTMDWSHGNAGFLDEGDDAWVISLRSQDAVIKIRRSNHSIAWIQGPHDRWAPAWQPFLLTPVGFPFEWQYHQHSPDLDSSGKLTMFDNGNYRAIPPVPAAPVDQWYSRAVQFQIDPVAMTTSQVWDWRDTTPFFSGQFGDVDPLPATGNYLVTDGAKPVGATNKTYSRIVEVKAATPGQQVVYEVIFNDPTGPTPNPYNWNLYRAERYGSMYRD